MAIGRAGQVLARSAESESQGGDRGPVHVAASRREVFNILSGQGFMQLFEPLSKFDDWYVKHSLLGL